MNIYLIRGKIEEQPYMDSIKEYEDIRIVLAHNEVEAVEKYQTFWESKNDAYSVTYYPWIRSCHEAIQ